jgi:hypothetical protein
MTAISARFSTLRRYTGLSRPKASARLIQFWAGAPYKKSILLWTYASNLGLDAKKATSRYRMQEFDCADRDGNLMLQSVDKSYGD